MPNKTGRPPLTDRATILAAAREIGFENGDGKVLTVGAVTTAVGVKYSTFYRHFPSIEALVAAMADDALDEVPQPGDHLAWDRHLHALSVGLRNVLLAHKGMAGAIGRLTVYPDRIQTMRSEAQLMLAGAGFTTEEAVTGVDAVLAMALIDPRETQQSFVNLTIAGIGADERDWT